MASSILLTAWKRSKKLPIEFPCCATGNISVPPLAAELPMPKLIQWMVGREMEQHFPRHLPHIGDDRLRVEEFSVDPDQHRGKPVVNKVSFSVRSG